MIHCVYCTSAGDGQTSYTEFDWPPVSDIAVVTKPRRETRWNLLECPKLPNRSQPLVGQSSSYCWNIWRRYCCLISFFPIVDMCLPCENLRRYSPITLCNGAQIAISCVIFASSFFSKPHAAHFRHASKFALRPHHVWMYGSHPISHRWE